MLFLGRVYIVRMLYVEKEKEERIRPLSGGAGWNKCSHDLAINRQVDSADAPKEC